MDFTSVTPYQYYNTTSLHGTHKYSTLKEVVNNFMLNYVGDDQLIKNIARYKVLFHAKRGLQELSYDILKDVKAIELVINPDTLTAILPQGYVDYVRISQVHTNGAFIPLQENTSTTIGKNYLQDHQYNILFDFNGDVLLDSLNSFDPTRINSEIDSAIQQYYHYDYYEDDLSEGGLFWLDTSKANINPWFVIDERSGVIKFSSEVGDSAIVIEYISDGLDYADESQIVIHKYCEEVLYAYINWVILDNMDGVQEYIVRRKKLDYKAKFNNSAIRRMDLDYSQLAQTLKGRQNWIK